MRRWTYSVVAGAALQMFTGSYAAQSAELIWGGKLLLTGGVKSIEGSAGGGLSSWAVITGNETRDGIGGSSHGTYVSVSDFNLTTYGAAIGFYDRFELSYAHQNFDTDDAGAALGLGQGFSFKQDIYGAKLRLFGDAVYDQDSWLPQVAVGVQYKKNDKGPVISAIGGADDDGIDYYVAATKILLNQSLVLNGTLRMTKANQTGLLGFGGIGNDDYSAEFEGAFGYLLSKRLLVGGEYRTKPDNLAFANESDWFDLYAAYAINKTVAVTLAYVDLGDIATFEDQRGVYISLQAGF